MHQKIPIKLLVRQSGKLIFAFLFGAFLITSLQDFDLTRLVYRAISMFTLFSVLFTISTALLYFFDKQRKNTTEKIWKKTFFCGYVISFFVFLTHHYIIQYLEQQGLFIYPREHLQMLVGWKFIVFMLYATLVAFSFIFFIQNFVLNQYEAGRIQLELIQLKSSNAETTNQLLKQQIQPHFLFNALNTLKSLIRKRPDTAEDYLIRLSDFLRASFSHSESGLNSLADELKICSNYMEMQKIRFGDSISYVVNIPANDPDIDKLLPVFSLQPLLENAIKHNVATLDQPLFVTIQKEGDRIVVANNLQVKNSMETSTGNGLSNLKERYRLISGDEVLINHDDSSFAVGIKLLKHEYRNH